MISKGNVPYYMAGTLAAFTLLASGVFAAAPYVGFLAPVAALSIGLPFIIGCAVLSAVAIALSAVAISKNNTISQQGKLESCIAQRKQEEENARAGLKAKGLLPNVPYKNVEASSPKSQPTKEGNGQSWGAWAWQNKSKIGVGAVAVGGVAWLAYVAANGGLGVADSSSSIVSNPVDSTESGGFCVADSLSSIVSNPVDSTESGGFCVADSSSSIASNPVDSTEDGTSLYALASTIISIIFISYGLDVDFTGPIRDHGWGYYH
ncbi:MULTISPECIES: hypothetical protein [Wolbachia]|uniref:Uncharacterized protein n=1 Tax=Wolbachia pipientis TaxID=955 RepID=A0A7G5CBI7_WOLPI|nr:MULTISPECIES: hypothetical protein [Wolbachia]MDE5060698.1 hypothetical protein [Wolbachia endosymbiont of Drosophila nikananu]QMV46571.1 hypothetical protein HC356_02510 [Wolbachia pipientis]